MRSFSGVETPSYKITIVWLVHTFFFTKFIKVLVRSFSSIETPYYMVTRTSIKFYEASIKLGN